VEATWRHNKWILLPYGSRKLLFCPSEDFGITHVVSVSF